MDSLNKRLDWLGAVCGSLGLTEVTLLPGRAEELSRRPDLRDAFDLATARAVAPLRLLSELCLPFVRPGGHFLAMKAMDSAQELQEAEPAIRLLQGRPLPPAEYSIPHTDITRRVLLVEKLAPTPDVYPRRWAKMQKVPL
ncbi:Ribosomal RNA small subunit methyltransferase G [bioreactor metagenome]|uniref:Ribosomal RNA small subunit methyltransferase G n=1 Tax=bioreactor metagenome TaxID=1076179 RepID=A0A645DUP7_9ZZZZ